MKALMEKYQPEGGYGDFLKEKLDITAAPHILWPVFLTYKSITAYTSSVKSST